MEKSHQAVPVDILAWWAIGGGVVEIKFARPDFPECSYVYAK